MWNIQILDSKTKAEIETVGRFSKYDEAVDFIRSIMTPNLAMKFLYYVVSED